MGRVYRQGQTRRVIIWRMLCTGTVEERIYMRQLFKKGLDGLVGEGGDCGGGDADDDDGGGDGGGLSDDAAEGGGGRGDRGADVGPMARGGGGSGLSTEELKAIFTYDESAPSATLGALVQGDRARIDRLADTDGEWVDALPDAVLREAITRGDADGAALRAGISFACGVGLLSGLAQEAAAIGQGEGSGTVDAERWGGDDDDEEAESGDDNDEGEDSSLPPPTPSSSASAVSLACDASKAANPGDEPDDGGHGRGSDRRERGGAADGGGVSELELESDDCEALPRRSISSQGRKRPRKGSRRIVETDSD